MKKLLLLLQVVGLTLITTTTVVACGVGGQINPNYQDEIQVPLSEQKIEIQQSILARMRTLILDNEYKISDSAYKSYSLSQNAQDLTKLNRDAKKTIGNVFETYFGSTNLNDVSYSNNITLDGSLGDQGGIFNLLLSGFNSLLPSGLSGILDKLSGLSNIPLLGDLISTINGFLGNFPPNMVNNSGKLIQILQSLNLTTIADGLPLGIDKLATLEVSKTQLTLINLLRPLLKQTTIDGFFTILAQGINFDFSTYQISDLSSIFWIELVNSIALFKQSDYQMLTYTNESSTIQAQLITAGQSFGTMLGQTSTTSPSFGSMIQGVACLLKAFSALGLKMTLLNSESKLFAPIDSEHLFSSDDNTTYLTAKLNATIGESDLVNTYPTLAKYFNFGEFFSNLVYFFDNDSSITQERRSARVLKFINVLFADKITNNKVSSNSLAFFTGIFSQTNPDSGLSDNNQISSAASEIDQFLTPSLLNNQAINLPSSSSTTFTSNVITWLQTDSEFLATPFATLYSGDLTSLFTSTNFSLVVGKNFADKIQGAFQQIFAYQRDGKINLENFLNSKLLNLLIGFKAKGYSAEDLVKNNGLFPNYGAYYTNKTLVELMNEFKNGLNLTGKETISQLTYRYFDIGLFNQVIDEVLYDSDGKTSLLTRILEYLKTSVSSRAKPEAILSALGYENDSDKGYGILVDSLAGRLLQAFAPDLVKNYASADGSFLSVNDLRRLNPNYTDNFQFFAKQSAEVLTQLIKPTQYQPWLNAVLSAKPAAFVIDSSATRWTTKTDGLYGGVVKIKFNPKGIVVLTNPNPKVVLTQDASIYQVTFMRTNLGKVFTITNIQKLT